jgi:hypothetical protein
MLQFSLQCSVTLVTENLGSPEPTQNPAGSATALMGERASDQARSISQYTIPTVTHSTGDGDTGITIHFHLSIECIVHLPLVRARAREYEPIWYNLEQIFRFSSLKQLH